MSGTGKSSVIARLWREERIQDLLSREDAAAIFVSGCTRNQVRFYAQFDSIILDEVVGVTLDHVQVARSG